jgi:hypothetical protein
MAQARGIAVGQANVDQQVSPQRPTQLREGLFEHRVARLGLRVVRTENVEHADAARAVGLLRA